MMYAVIESGGKQYRVELGTEIAVDRLEVEAGQSIDFERVLLVADQDEAAIGRPTVAGARVSADVVRQARGDKIVVFKYRPKARKRTKQGHRADLTVLRISDIVLAGKSAKQLGAAARAESERIAAEAAESASRLVAADQALAAKLAGEAAAAEEARATAEAIAKPQAKPKPKITAAAKAEPDTKAAAKVPLKAEPTTTAAPKASKAPKSAASRTQAPPPVAKPRAPRATKKDE
jgi:large subunit ribosomal protein L21